MLCGQNSADLLADLGTHPVVALGVLSVPPSSAVEYRRTDFHSPMARPGAYELEREQQGEFTEGAYGFQGR